MKIQLSHKFEEIISINNLLEAWKEFEKGKRNRKDVQEFSLNLMNNILLLHSDLIHYTYKHGGYQAFKISDPKPRCIHKASARDRLLHHAICRLLYPFFDRTFINDSYSCRINKGTHRAVNRFAKFTRATSKNNVNACWVLQCDIRKFFASIDHEVLLNILMEYIPDKDILWLLEEIISSFNCKPGVGLPLGNLTSQLFVNIYMNEFDQFVKHKLKAKKYIRYADDFVIVDSDLKNLKNLNILIDKYLITELKLELHSKKTKIRKFKQGVNFLGFVVCPHYIILKTKTKRRVFRKIKASKRQLDKGIITKEFFNQSLQSYYGVLKHCEGHKLKVVIDNIVS